MNNKDRIIWVILAISLLIGGFAFSITSSRAEEHNMEKDCYLNMPQEQVVVCLKSMRLAVEDMVEQTKELLKNAKPVKIES